MGKTTLLENMILSDIYAGYGCCYIDPHGDTAEKLLDYIPSWRINDVVYFNPADLDYPIGFNILETVNDAQKHLVGSGLMDVFKKIWPDVWSPRMEYILLNCVLALLDFPGATLLGINRLLVDKDFRQRVIEKIRDPIVKTFWVAEFSSWSEKYATEAIAPVQNKVGQFLSASVIRNIVAQVKSTILPRRIMDDRKIFIVNLSKGRIGEDNMRLLGGMLITKIKLAAMERVDMAEEEREDFFLYVDEFQNFATPSFANILSEARKYRLALIMAHQYIEQLDETVRDAVFGNVGTLIIFRVGSPDATYMEKEFAPSLIPEDLTNLPKFGIYLKLMVDGVTTEPFSALTLPPIAQRTGSAEKVINVSRERYATPKSVIEDKVLKWSGMETGPEKPDHAEGNVVATGDVSYPRLETEEEKETAEGENEEPGEAREYLRFSAERMASLSKSMPAKKKDKPKFKHTCSRCGAVWEMPIQLDPTRPMYCAECLPLIKDEKKIHGKVLKAAVTGGVPEGVDIEEVKDQPADAKDHNPFTSAMRAMEEGGQHLSRPKPKSAEPNRPRIVLSKPDKLVDVVNEEEEEDEEKSELLDAIASTRGTPVETRKAAAVPQERIETREVRGESRSDAPRRPLGDVSYHPQGDIRSDPPSSSGALPPSSKELRGTGGLRGTAVDRGTRTEGRGDVRYTPQVNRDDRTNQGSRPPILTAYAGRDGESEERRRRRKRRDRTRNPNEDRRRDALENHFSRFDQSLPPSTSSQSRPSSPSVDHFHVPRGFSEGGSPPPNRPHASSGPDVHRDEGAAVRSFANERTALAGAQAEGTALSSSRAEGGLPPRFEPQAPGHPFVTPSATRGSDSIASQDIDEPSRIVFKRPELQKDAPPTVQSPDTFGGIRVQQGQSIKFD